jgi:hypothetical protein
MKEGKKQALRNSFVGKAVSEMTSEELILFGQEFQYGFSNRAKQKPALVVFAPLVAPKGSTMAFLDRMNLVVKK